MAKSSNKYSLLKNILIISFILIIGFFLGAQYMRYSVVNTSSKISNQANSNEMNLTSNELTQFIQKYISHRGEWGNVDWDIPIKSTIIYKGEEINGVKQTGILNAKTLPPISLDHGLMDQNDWKQEVSLLTEESDGYSLETPAGKRIFLIKENLQDVTNRDSYNQAICPCVYSIEVFMSDLQEAR